MKKWWIKNHSYGQPERIMDNLKLLLNSDLRAQPDFKVVWISYEIEISYKDILVFVYDRSDEQLEVYHYGSWVKRLNELANSIRREKKLNQIQHFSDLKE